MAEPDPVQQRTEIVDAAPAEAFAGLFDLPVPSLSDGAELPLLWHWLYFLERPAQHALGADGHALTGIPRPRPGRRRMYAGGRVRSTAALRLGEPATRRTWEADVVEKEGRSGSLQFVTVHTEVSQRGIAVISEDTDIVYRAGAPAGAVGPGTPEPSKVDDEGSEGAWSPTIAETVLFRFSALTYNAHRIHYDRDYAQGVEGYPDLVVHGPLQAMLMAEHHRRRYGERGPVEYAYRLVAPLFLGQGLVVSEEPHPAGSATHNLQVSDLAGRTTATASLRVG